LVADAIFSDAEPLARRFRPQVAHLAAIWERRWNEALARATPQELAADEWGWLPSCDRAWANLVQTHLAPHGYRMQAGASRGCCDGAIWKANFLKAGSASAQFWGCSRFPQCRETRNYQIV
jgi:ssDNA-binding Zn-finger/Zn-ribbon topoisomerase 1